MSPIFFLTIPIYVFLSGIMFYALFVINKYLLPKSNSYFWLKYLIPSLLCAPYITEGAFGYLGILPYYFGLFDLDESLSELEASWPLIIAFYLICMIFHFYLKSNKKIICDKMESQEHKNE